MWLFTKYGMYSVVCTKDNPQVIMVRARVKEHLLALKKRFAIHQGYKILTTPKADYKFRLLLPKEKWAIIACQLAEDIDYSNFKDQIRVDHAYHRAASEIWGVMWDLQERR